ncbi:MAG: restriction endonuclease subunit S [Candidatus Marsarchaeota archaeon]|nr:restriction endonuclease subunit S [Candidatus Marsarchaeota archaeon]
MIDNAYTSRNQKQLKAQQLLRSINDYIFEELGINLPKLREKIAYVVDSSKIRNRRIDSYYYQPKFEDIEDSIKKSKYNVKEIGTVIEINSKLENINSYGEINYVDLSSIEKDTGEIKSTALLTPSEAPSRARQKLERGDLLLAGLSGSLKSIAILERDENNFICSTGFYIIKRSKNYNNYYLWALFRSPLYQYLLNREATGAIMSAINKESLLKLEIPFPPLTVQDKIAEEVKKRLNEAILLQRESETELSRAKETVEKLMLSA